eukprot:TRINITY_DN3701_c0_g1_i1.p1 TRINITY_DN3701_c0_g1~~TRINITY_DN3701_c0_g1_i1.p1  ORF type:complete len:174 (+),score=22.81 TRINITY_DN3701_c0_g1_i1:36-524(+)
MVRCCAAALLICALLVCLQEGVHGGQYTNPVVNEQCPDPGAILVGEDGVYYVATTSQGNSDAFPIRASKDLVNWSIVSYVFPDAHKPKWAATDFWAPEIHRVKDHYVVYFAARDTTGMLCVGVGVSSKVTGPFEDPLGHPLVRNSTVGNIDPTLYIDSASNT